MVLNPLRRHVANMAEAFRRVGPNRKVGSLRLEIRLPADDPDTRGLRPGKLIPVSEPLGPFTEAKVSAEDRDGSVLVTLTWRSL